MEPGRTINFDQLGLNIRPVQPEDGPRVVRLLEQVYGHWGNLEDWKWKYLASPAPFQLDSVLAEYQGRIIGHYGMLPVETIWNSQLVPAGQGIDAGVLPEHRRSGVYTALAQEVLRRACDAGVKFIYAFPGLMALNVNLQHGYRAAGFVPELTRVLDLKRALALNWEIVSRDLIKWWTARRRGEYSPEAAHRLVRLRRCLLLLASFVTSPYLSRPVRLQANKILLNPVEQFDARLDTLWERVRGSSAFGLCKESRYLTWRYNRHPSRSYQVLVIEAGDQWAGYLVMRHTDLRSEIAELLALPERPDVVPDLLREAIAQARMAGSIEIGIWANSEHPSFAGLRQAGFVSSARLFGLANHWPGLARHLYQIIIFVEHLPLEHQLSLTSLAKTWQYSMGDSDLV